MRGLRRRILAVIEEVNHEIRVDLGLEEPTLEDVRKIEEILDLPCTYIIGEFKKVDNEDESEEAKAFEKVLDEISLRYENVKAEIAKEFDEFEASKEQAIEIEIDAINI